MKRKKRLLAGKLHLAVSLLCAPMALGAGIALRYEIFSPLEAVFVFLTCMIVSRIEYSKFVEMAIRNKLSAQEDD